MGIRFACSACSEALNIKNELAGRRSKCPKCGQRFRIPLQDQQFADPLEEDSPAVVNTGTVNANAASSTTASPTTASSAASRSQSTGQYCRRDARRSRHTRCQRETDETDRSGYAAKARPAAGD